MTTAAGDRLAVYLNTTPVGYLTSDSDQVVSFGYDDAYVGRLDATPLSLSLPLTADQHPPARVAAFLWGLLPDNENTLNRVAADAATSARNVFGLLAHVGRDTAGALQILRLDVDPTHPGSIEWIDAAELAVRVAEVRQSATSGLPFSTTTDGGVSRARRESSPSGTRTASGESRTEPNRPLISSSQPYPGSLSPTALKPSC